MFFKKYLIVLKEHMEFEKQLLSLRSVMNISEDEMRKFGVKALSIAKNLGTASTLINKKKIKHGRREEDLDLESADDSDLDVY